MWGQKCSVVELKQGQSDQFQMQNIIYIRNIKLRIRKHYVAFAWYKKGSLMDLYPYSVEERRRTKNCRNLLLYIRKMVRKMVLENIVFASILKARGKIMHSSLKEFRRHNLNAFKANVMYLYKSLIHFNCFCHQKLKVFFLCLAFLAVATSAASVCECGSNNKVKYFVDSS